jgi:hypothetical protein
MDIGCWYLGRMAALMTALMTALMVALMGVLMGALMGAWMVALLSALMCVWMRGLTFDRDLMRVWGSGAVAAGHWCL